MTAPAAPALGGDGAGRELATERIRAAYVELTGSVPASIETRLALAEQAGRQHAVEVIEALREALIMENPLGRRTGQLVHFGQLVALGSAEAARLHARAARTAGAGIEELVGVAELALITAGMPCYSLGVQIVAELVAEEASNASSVGPPPGQDAGSSS